LTDIPHAQIPRSGNRCAMKTITKHRFANEMQLLFRFCSADRLRYSLLWYYWRFYKKEYCGANIVERWKWSYLTCGYIWPLSLAQFFLR